jgi:hypothetical protein|tara:strand:+ start:215 stop:805 length:591 start_codon:yes stop_codon:yes gene_type:complete
MKNVVFIHCWKHNNWEDILQEQLDYIKSSGLEEESDIEIRYSEYEGDALIDMYKFSFQSDSNILYLHIKGVTHYQTKFQEIADNHRRWLMDGVIGNWKKYISYLDEYDVVGDNYKEDTFYRDIWPDKVSKNSKRVYSRHFAGTFFWTKSDYVKELINPIRYFTERSKFETWICSNKGKFKEVRRDCSVEPHEAWNL